MVNFPTYIFPNKSEVASAEKQYIISYILNTARIISWKLRLMPKPSLWHAELSEVTLDDTCLQDNIYCVFAQWGLPLRSFITPVQCNLWNITVLNCLCRMFYHLCVISFFGICILFLYFGSLFRQFLEKYFGENVLVLF